MTWTNPPERLTIDVDNFSLSCVEDAEEFGVGAYVDVVIDTVPLTDDDPDYSDRPDLLRKAAAWLEQAADWLEEMQG
jgi:hypothetical protein